MDYPGSMMNMAHGPRYSSGFEYRIIPLSSPMIRKQRNDRDLQKFSDEEYGDQLYVGQRVSGYSLDLKRNVTGRIVNFIFDAEEPDYARYVVVQDEETVRQVRVFPQSIVVLPQAKGTPGIRLNPYAQNSVICYESQQPIQASPMSLSAALFGDGSEGTFRSLVVDSGFVPDRYIPMLDVMLASGGPGFTFSLLTYPQNLMRLFGMNYLDSKVGASTIVQRLIAMYEAMSGRQINVISVKARDSIIDIQTSKPCRVSSWFEMWCFVKAIAKTMKIRSREPEYENQFGPRKDQKTEAEGLRLFLDSFLESISGDYEDLIKPEPDINNGQVHTRPRK